MSLVFYRFFSFRIWTFGLLLTALGVGLFAAKKEFKDYYELDPITVKGQEIPITVFARGSGDRSYGMKLAQKVVETAYVTLERSPGDGLVVVGRKKEPHPIFLFNHFLEIARREGSPVAMREKADQLDAALQEWREQIDFDAEDAKEELPIDLETLLQVLPLPLDGVTAEVYLIAWQQDFDEERSEAAWLAAFAEGAPESSFNEFDWIFYLPPKSALNQVLKEALPVVFEENDFGVMKRALARAALATFKPIIMDAMEAMRKGVFYWSILHADGTLDKGDSEALVEAYLESQMPRGKIISGNKLEHGLEAVREQKLKNEAYARDPYVVPSRRGEYRLDDYRKFEGDYAREGHDSFYFKISDGSVMLWGRGEDQPVTMYPATERKLVSENGKMTLEFFANGEGDIDSLELRRERYRAEYQKVIPEAE